MNTYIGTKIVRAEPMTEQNFLVQRRDPYIPGEIKRPGFLVVYPDGYESWSPKEVFEATYRLVSDDEKTIVCGGAE